MTMSSKIGALACFAALALVPISAHAKLENRVLLTEPAQRIPDTNLVLTFPAVVDLSGTKVELLDSDRREIPIEKLELSGGGSDVSVPLREPLLPGTYTVRWQARALDGRENQGTYVFDVSN